MDCYQAYYCGLCQSLGRKYGTAARMALSYDMTFAALLHRLRRGGARRIRCAPGRGP